MEVYLSLGTNLGEKEENSAKAIGLLKENEKIQVKALSSIYRTEPVGEKNQDWFLNMAVKIETTLSPRELLNFCQEIEQKMSRKRIKKWGPRIIDVDILLYGEEIIEEADLKIPHPLMTTRNFVLVPLTEIAPKLRHPVNKKLITELLPAEGKIERRGGGGYDWK